MENSADVVMGNAANFFSAKEMGRKGYGLDSVKAITRRYKGEAEFRYDEETKVFTSTVLLMT